MEQEKRSTRVVIVGSGPSARGKAGHIGELQSDGWKVWVPGSVRIDGVVPDTIFEVHPKNKWPIGHDEYLRKMGEETTVRFRDPRGIGYGLRAFYDDAPLKKYATSTIAYMLRMAAFKPSISHIRLIGVDILEEEEYQNQRPCIEYWLGYLEGRGCNVHITPGSALFSGDLYGEPEVKDEFTKWLELEAIKAKACREQAERERVYFLGAMQAEQVENAYLKFQEAEKQIVETACIERFIQAAVEKRRGV